MFEPAKTLVRIRKRKRENGERKRRRRRRKERRVLYWINQVRDLTQKQYISGWRVTRGNNALTQIPTLAASARGESTTRSVSFCTRRLDGVLTSPGGGRTTHRASPGDVGPRFNDPEKCFLAKEPTSRVFHARHISSFRGRAE